MNTCVIALTDDGANLAQKIAGSLEKCSYLPGDGPVAEIIRHAWQHYDGIICVMAAGIVVRSVAPLIKDKLSDPCVIVLDQKGRHVVSLLSGHVGGGNNLAIEVAKITGGTPVITTASDVLGMTALDLWAERNTLLITDRKKMTRLSARQVNGHSPRVFDTLGINRLPADYTHWSTTDGADIVISYKNEMTREPLCCIPRVLYLGVGCNRNTPEYEIVRSFGHLCSVHSIKPAAFAGLASIDVKQDEEGIRSFAANLNLDEFFFSKTELNTVQGVSFSQAAMKAVGARGVAEPSAILAAGGAERAHLIIPKMKFKDVTLAVAERIKRSWE